MLVLAGGLSAQTDLKQAVAKWKGAASAGFSLSLGQVSDPGATEGQLILLRLQHKAPYEQRFGMPLPPVRYQFGGFLLHPPVDECGWLERPCINPNPLLANKFDTLTTLDLHQQQIETDLNTYTPPLSPGRYQAAAVMRKQVLVSQSGGQVGFRYAEPEQYLVSNPIALEVRPATEEWLRHTIEAARKTLLAPVRGEDEYMMRERAARQIAAINHPKCACRRARVIRAHQRSPAPAGRVPRSPSRGCVRADEVAIGSSGTRTASRLRLRHKLLVRSGHVQDA